MALIRVAQLSPTYFDESSYIGGGERYVFNIVRSLQQHCSEEIETQVISFTKNIPFDAEVVTISKGGISTKLLPNLLQSENLMEAASNALWKELPAFDVVHIHQLFSVFGVVAISIARQLGLPIVATDLGGGGSPAAIQKHICNLVDAITCISEFSAKMICPMTTTPIHVISGPVDTDVFCPPMRSIPREKQISCVGRILPHKGIDRVIRALPSGLPLIVCGRVYDSRYYDVLQNLAKGKDVRFVTNANDSDIIHLYQTSVANVLASTYQDCFGIIHMYPELMGLTVIESMACGAAAIVSRVASLPELVIPDETGRIFDDEDQLAAFFGEIKSGDWLPSQSSERCVAHVDRSYSTHAVADAMLTVYHTAMNARSRATQCEY